MTEQIIIVIMIKIIKGMKANNTSRQNEYNCKPPPQKKCPMNGLCNLENVVYQGIIYPKENVKDTKIYIRISTTK